MPDTHLIEAGTLLMVTSGDTYDERPQFLARANGDLDLPTLREAWRVSLEALEEWEKDTFEDHRFLQWLVVQGHLQPVVATRLWIAGSGYTDEIKPLESPEKLWWWVCE